MMDPRLQVLTNTYHKAMKVVKENGRLLLYRVLPNMKLVKTVSGIFFFKHAADSQCYSCEFKSLAVQVSPL